MTQGELEGIDELNASLPKEPKDALAARKAELEQELEYSAHANPELVATSVRHCGLQAEYWSVRMQMALRAADGCADHELRGAYLREARDASGLSEQWEKRKGTCANQMRLDLLRELGHKLSERERAAERLRGGKGKKPRKAAQPRGLDDVYNISDEQAIELWGWLLSER